MGYRLDGVSQGERIRNLFKENGHGENIRRFTQLCLASGIFDESQIEGFTMVGAMKTVKSALKEKDDDGMQFAYSTTKSNGEKAIWKIRENVNYLDACFILQCNYIDKIAQTHAEMVTFHNWMRRRFGTAPSIPVLE